MKTQVIKKLSPRQAFINRVFPKNNLDVVLQTCDISIAEFEKLWLNTKGYASTGNQYSNMDNYDYVYCISADEADAYEHDKENGNSGWWLKYSPTAQITKSHDGGYVMYHARAHGNRHHKHNPAPLPADFKLIYRKRWRYLSNPECCSQRFGDFIIARRSKCGQYVTVFKSRG